MMIGPVIMAILCHSAYLNIFTVILNAPPGVVAPSFPTGTGKGVESVVHDSSVVDLSLAGGGKDFSRSGLKGEDLATAPTPNDAKVSDEETLLGHIEVRQQKVIKAKKDMQDSYGSQVEHYSYGDLDALESLAIIKTALKERRWEEGRFSFSNIYRMIFKNSQWKQDQLSLKLKHLKEIRPIERVKPLEAQLAIKRLSILEFKGFDFSKEEGQLIEELSKQAKYAKGSSQDDIRFKLSTEELNLIENIAWERVVERKLEEIRPKIEVFRKIAKAGNDEVADEISLALANMESIIHSDKAQWSPQMTRLLKTIKNMKTDGDKPHLKLSEKDRKAIQEMLATSIHIILGKSKN
ncbi:hypothetical protein PSTG_03706 [Puccinia striiformis f. sp. tritici PST-78]|uniref:Uncharacterized protein n=1 Tax=Puccinia striiformis f. sp. tritici PST-78 TaxID=1165861 RepID=A0A0L0VV31_9BASI|nr:hypothetical protein PSTG_03706 [Puccinia striiformis f. sp. tritici PST-78]